MVDQLPNLGRESEMLAVMGLDTIDQLFADIPEAIRRNEPLDLRPPQSEEEIWADAQRLLGANVPLNSRPSFLGAGLYSNFVPTMVGMLATRGEFLTAYTPYQPEVSQGMLQTMISELTGLPVSNGSMYDASTAAAEALTCAVRVHGRKAEQKRVVYVSDRVPEQRLSVMRNYTTGGGIEIRLLASDERGMVDIAAAETAAGACAVYVEQPTFYGVIDEGLAGLKAVIGENTALVVGVQPVSLGLLEAPGEWGADIVVGEGQPFGIGPTAGGPIYGLFACRDAYIRQMPGRIVGQTRDEDGADAFTLTLSTREQHIRRHRATSNICSNETLIALMGSMHMALLGPEGLEWLALRNAAAATVTMSAVLSVDGIDAMHPESSHFNEFAVRLPGPSADALRHLDARGITGGLDLGGIDAALSDHLLITATDQTSTADAEALAAGLTAWVASLDAGTDEVSA